MRVDFISLIFTLWASRRGYGGLHPGGNAEDDRQNRKFVDLLVMKMILQQFNLKRYLNFEKVLFYTLVFILSLMFLRINIIQQAIGSESLDEPHISLKVNNQRLGDVLEEITLDTGFEFKLNDQWSAYPVNASIENMPLNRGLKLILQGLNHAIIYESDKSIKIMVFGKVDSRKTNSYPVQPSSSQIQDNQQEPALSPESSPEWADIEDGLLLHVARHQRPDRPVG